MAKANPFRFSTKYQDDETDLLYYGYRYYSGSAGRWLSRDPIKDRGFSLMQKITNRKAADYNDYLFVRNEPLRLVDSYGLSIADVANYYSAFVDELKQLCICHLARPEWGWIQNCGPCWGCTKQTENLESVMDAVRTEDVFRITVYYRPNPCWPLFHNSVRIEPTNSQDPVIDADTWKGCFSVTWPKGSSQKDFNRCFTCKELLKK